jgi:hypothetical protein
MSTCIPWKRRLHWECGGSGDLTRVHHASSLLFRLQSICKYVLRNPTLIMKISSAHACSPYAAILLYQQFCTMSARHIWKPHEVLRMSLLRSSDRHRSGVLTHCVKSLASGSSSHVPCPTPLLSCRPLSLQTLNTKQSAPAEAHSIREGVFTFTSVGTRRSAKFP